MMTKFRYCLFIACIVSLIPLFSAKSEEHYAALLTVTHAGVQMMRENTAQWLDLPSGSEAPFGIGDAVKTDEEGRAIIIFQDAINVLILPRSTYTIIDFRVDKGLYLSAKLDGDMLQQVFSGSSIRAYSLVTPVLTVVQPAQWMGIWSRGGEAGAAVVAEGEGGIEANATGEGFSLSSGGGVRLEAEGEGTFATIEAPLTAPHLEGHLKGCPGKIQTAKELNLNVRVGPGFSYTVIGNIDNNAFVQLMGISEFNTWYRIQAFSGFGWVRRELVQSNCDSLPVLPTGSREYNTGLHDIQPDELALLQPFYGLPESDPWFYLSLESPSQP